jgi:SagB-type dehydrogenase family enzyme
MTAPDPDPALFRSTPLAWTFHRGTARWMFSPLSPAAPPLLPGREHPRARWFPLPPSTASDLPLQAAIDRRVSCRAFTPDGVPLPALAALVRGAYGVTGHSPWGTGDIVDRSVPSAGGLYPLELSLIVRAVDGLDPGVYHVVPAADGLEQLRNDAIPEPLLTYLFMGQPWVAQAALIAVLSAVPGRTLPKYGDRGYRYLLIEAGHAGQNLTLTAATLGLGVVSLGGFFDDEVAGLLRLDTELEFPLYALAVGVPAAESRMGRRALPALDGH